MKTLEEIFDAASIGMLKQGKKSMAGNRCVYRSDDGCKCGVGFLIAEEHYKPTLEGKNISRVVVKYALQYSGVDIDDFATANLLEAIQNIHDGHSVGNWPSSLQWAMQVRGKTVSDAFLQAVKEFELTRGTA